MLYSDHNRPNAAYMHTPYLWSPFYIDSQSTIQSVFYLKFGLFVYFVVDFFFSSNTLSNEHTYTMLSISSCLCLNAFQVVFLRLLLCCNVNFIQVSLFVWKEWDFMRFYFMFFSSLSFNFWIFTRKKCVPYTYRCFLLLLHFHFLKKTYAYNSQWRWQRQRLRRYLLFLWYVHMSLLCTYIVRWCWNAPLHFVIFNPLYQHHCKHRQDSPFVQKKNVSLEYYASLYYVYCTVQYNVHVLSRITLFDHYNHVLKLMIAYASFCLWNPIRLMWKYSFLILGLPKIKINWHAEN